MSTKAKVTGFVIGLVVLVGYGQSVMNGDEQPAAAL